MKGSEARWSMMHKKSLQTHGWIEEHRSCKGPVWLGLSSAVQRWLFLNPEGERSMNCVYTLASCHVFWVAFCMSEGCKKMEKKNERFDLSLVIFLSKGLSLCVLINYKVDTLPRQQFVRSKFLPYLIPSRFWDLVCSLLNPTPTGSVIQNSDLKVALCWILQARFFRTQICRTETSDDSRSESE